MIEHTSCLEKQNRLRILFSDCTTFDTKYAKIIELGKTLELYPLEFKTPDKLVKGCQGELYLYAKFENGKMFFTAQTDALISAGLAVILIAIYSGESPDVILTCPPTVLDDIGIRGGLSPSRSNGLASLFLKMKQEALFYIRSNSHTPLKDQ